MPLLINDEEVKQIVNPQMVLQAVEDADRQYGLGLAGVDGFCGESMPPPKRELRIAGRGLPHGHPENIAIGQGLAYLNEYNMAILQHTFRFKERKGGMFHLIDTMTGNTLAIIMNDGYISRLRTGATGAVAAKYLSRKDSEIAGIIGTGKQGRTQLEFLMKVRPIKKVISYSGRRKDESYANEMATKLGIEVIAVDNAESVVRNSEICVTVTKSTTPIVKGEWMVEGLHINALGADCPFKAELDASALKRADKLVIDCKQALDTGDMKALFERGIFEPRRVYGTIGEIVAGIKQGRENNTEVTVFKSTGMTIPYVAITRMIYEEALRRGIGSEMPSLL